jgi:pathogenesis-related protein 1
MLHMKLAFQFCILAIFISLTAAPAIAQKKSKPAPGVKPAIVVNAKCETNGLKQSEITELLSSHNRARTEQKLPPLVWNCLLANMAQNWASRGVFAHRGDTSYGENIFVSSNAAEPVATVVNVWLTEKGNWNNKSAICVNGKTCTHYTQVMWNTTTQVGCGINRSSPGQWRTLVVCNYSPAGNSGGPAY